jgi:predicted secreted protein
VYRVVHIASRGVNFNSITPPNLPACTEGSNIIQVTKNCPAAFTSQPNPTTGTSWATFSVGNDALTTLEVYDVSGRKVAEIFRQNAQAEVEYRVEFDGSNLPNGVYLYRLTTGSEVIVDKFMIAR